MQQTTVTIRQAQTDLKSCLQAVANKPEYAPLLPHTPDLATGEPSMAQLTDETVPTPDDARLFVARHDEMAPCRRQLLTTLSAVRPDAVPTLANAMTASDQVLVQLVERKITWAEGMRQHQQIMAQARDKLAAADREWFGEMRVENQAELDRRQAAANAMMQWSLQQQMINAATRPVVTNCNTLGSFVNCTSH
jgi:hypothetical protein